jgi:hypothetical protein
MAKGTQDDPIHIQCSEVSGHPPKYIASHCGATISTEHIGDATTCPACKKWVQIVNPPRTLPPPPR